MKSLLVKSYAKINICLNVVGKREDGYHELDMIMLPLEMHDSMIIKNLGRKVENNFVTIDDFSMGPLTYNLATLAIEKLAAKSGFNEKFMVTIHKVIPMQSGLGGGSSNAAHTLVGINKLLHLGLSDDELIEIGKPLGADIPFFVIDKPARCRGIGEKLDFITVKNDYYCLIVKPAQGCSTKGVYEASDTMDLPIGDVEKVLKALETGDDDLLAESIFNSLEAPAISLVPEIQVIKDKLFALGLKIVQMSGSGSAVFALSTDKKLIKQAFKALDKEYLVEMTKILK